MLHHSLKRNYEEEDYMKVHRKDERRGIMLWKIRVWNSKGIRKAVETKICLICRVERTLWLILDYQQMKE
jgi:hypothetical protein